MDLLLKDCVSTLSFKPVSLEEADGFGFETTTRNVKKFQEYFKELSCFIGKLDESNSAWDCFKNTLHYLTTLVYLISSDVDRPWYSCERLDEVKWLMKILRVNENELIEKNFKKVFRHSIKNLKTDQWKLHQIEVAILGNLIKKSPNEVLSENLFNVCPFVLKLVDDYNSKYVLEGLELLKHLFKTLPSAELKMHGLINVFFDALHKRLFYCDYDVLKELLPTLLMCLKIIQPKLRRLLKAEERQTAEKIFGQILTNVTMTSETDKNVLYFEFLEDFYRYMGVEMIAHLDNLSEFYVKYLEDCNYTLMPALTSSLLVLFKHAWVRVDCLQFLKPVVKNLMLLDRNKSKSAKIEKVYECLYELVGNLVTIDQSGDVVQCLSKLKTVSGMDYHLENINKLKNKISS